MTKHGNFTVMEHGDFGNKNTSKGKNVRLLDDLVTKVTTSSRHSSYLTIKTKMKACDMQNMCICNVYRHFDSVKTIM